MAVRFGSFAEVPQIREIRPVSAWKLPAEPSIAPTAMPGRHPGYLNLRLFCKLQGIFDLYPQIPDCAFEFGVPEQKLNRPQVFGPPVDQ